MDQLANIIKLLFSNTATQNYEKLQSVLLCQTPVKRKCLILNIVIIPHLNGTLFCLIPGTLSSGRDRPVAIVTLFNEG